MSSVPPSYNAVVLEDRAIKEKEKNTTSTLVHAAEEYDALVFSEAKDLPLDEQNEYQKGFAENHYKLWMAMRIFLMSGGIVFSCRKSRHIRCHVHGGSCGKYLQEKPCTRKYHSYSTGNSAAIELNKRSGLDHTPSGGQSCCSRRRKRRHCSDYRSC